MSLDGWSCPFPLQRYPRITLAHGGGGLLTAQLVEELFHPAFASLGLESEHDSAVFGCEKGRLAFSTDSYVVKPLFFSGGDIGTLAIYGTVNDLAMAGARASRLSCGFILEEGLPTETLARVVRSMREAAQIAGVSIVTGDTKVVERGRCDGIYINTSGIGLVEEGVSVHPCRIQAGDRILLSGDLGRHGIAVMAEREGLAFETSIQSDVAPLVDPVMALLRGGIDVRCLRDLTRGGLVSALSEIASVSRKSLRIEEACVEVHEGVRGACEILGLDPLYVANEGRFAAVVPAEEAERALAILRAHPVSREAVEIGEVCAGEGAGRVLARGSFGQEKILDRLSGEALPRIC